ncbi:hypothetical protein ALC60_00984, partial [Trachymyrmex zeteki]
VDAHPEKLTEEEKNEVKFHWTWDYYIAKSSTEALCKLCKVIVRCKTMSYLKKHLKKKHEISGPALDNVIDNENNSGDDMDANKDVDARCIHCDGKFIINMENLAPIHKHMVDAHPEKLTEEEKNEVKFHWAWDYLTRKRDRESTCKLCKARIRHNNKQNILRNLKRHLKRIHKIFGPGSDNHVDNKNISGNYVDADRNTTIRNAKYQEDLSNPTGSCNISYVETEGTEDLNE